MIEFIKKQLFLLSKLGFKKRFKYILLHPLKRVKKNIAEVDQLRHEQFWCLKVFTYHSTINYPEFSYPDQFEQSIDQYYKSFGLSIKKDWHFHYIPFSKKISEKYIPEDLFYMHIEPCLNDFSLTPYFNDKNGYEKAFPECNHPVTVCRFIRNRFYNKEYIEISASMADNQLLAKDGLYIIKPTRNSGGGKNIRQIHVINRHAYLMQKEVTIADLVNLYEGDFIIQGNLQQHSVLSEIYPHSLNTLRFITLRLDGEIHVLSTVVRFGNEGNFVDNISNNGICFSLRDNGEFREAGLAYNYNLCDQHPYSSIKPGGKKIPCFDSIKKQVIKMHKKMLYFDLISWDIGLDTKAEPVLIEMNLKKQSLNIHQLTNGPLFGDLTDRLLERVFVQDK